MMLSSSMWAWADTSTKTPIKHVVVVFQENVSFDHYYGVYPNAPGFTAKTGTPIPNNYISNPSLLTSNPNLFNPFLLSNVLTCDMDHEYLDEQKAYAGGLADKFVQFTTNSGSGCNPDGSSVMGYYDARNVTAMWNYAQNFAMSDNSFGTMFGPSTPGALNLISGQSFGASEDAVGGGSAISDTDPTYDDCSSTAFPTIAMSGKNIGDILNDNGITWGWFQGGFAPSTPWDGTPGHKAVCATKTPRTATDGSLQTAYSAHHEPFEYYNSTSNPHHLPPASNAEIGNNGQANHQYDLNLFYTAINNGNLPQVTFLKAVKARDGHAGYSDSLDEQVFLANVTNTIANSPYWPNTAVIIAYDDSDGWYDHVAPTIKNNSNDPLNDYAPECGGKNAGLGGANDRCGPGPRLPMVVISAYAKENYISHVQTDQSSIIKFVLQNWNLGGIPTTLGQQSFVNIAGSINDMFDFTNHGNTPKICLNAAGQVVPPVSGKCTAVNS